MPDAYAFTATIDGRPNVLKSPCDIEPAARSPIAFHSFEANWDTGATQSSITQDVVDQCGLKPIGKIKVAHAGIGDEPDETDVYLVNIRLPNQVTVENVQVSRGGFSGGEVLIGMDIINTGDLPSPMRRTRRSLHSRFRRRRTSISFRGSRCHHRIARNDVRGTA